MNRLSAQNQLIIGIVLIVAVALAGVFLAILPQFDRAKAIDAEMSKIESDIQVQEAVVARRMSAKQQAADAQVEMLRIANQVPEAPELPTVIVNLQDAANAAGLTFVQIQPGEPEVAVDDAGKPLGYTKIPITVSVRDTVGEWADHIDFLRRLSKLQRGIRVVDLKYSYIPPVDPEPAYIEGILKIEVYTMSVVRPTPAGAPRPSTPSTPPAGATPSQ